MTSLRLLGTLDPLVVASRLRLQYWERLDGEGDVKTLQLVDEEGPLPILRGEKGWKSAASFLTRLKNASAPFLGGEPADFERVWIEALQPHGHTPWTEDGPRETLHIRLCLSSPLNAWLYSGGEQMVLPQGAVAWVNTQALHSWVNLGDWPSVHLCADVRRPETDPLA